MAKVYDNGAFYGVSLNEDEISRWKTAWPGANLPKKLYAQFDKRNGDLVDVKGAGKFNGSELEALVRDAQCLAEHRLGISTFQTQHYGTCKQDDWKRLLDAPEEDETPSWVDRHSVNCIKCGDLADERECVPGKGHEGDVCPGCQRKRK